MVYIKPLTEGRESVSRPDLIKYLAINLAMALPVFVGIFGLAMVIPPIALRYWRWLKTSGTLWDGFLVWNSRQRNERLLDYLSLKQLL